jgi:exodeoxyribonuclease-3
MTKVNHLFVKQTPQLVGQVTTKIELDVPGKLTLFKVATWNVNSMRARHTYVKAYLQQEKPDVLVLQETKCINAKFPVLLHQENTGHHLCIMGQKQFNGVAILSRQPISNVLYTLPVCPDSLYRFQEASIQKMVILNVYVPQNSTSIDSVAYENKLTFMRYLYARLKQLTSEKRLVILLGDFNIFATDQDLYNPTANMWNEYCMKTAKERDALELLLSLGHTDLYAFYYPLSQFHPFTRWQHYSTQQDQKNGYRIDLIIFPTSSLPYVTDTTVHTAYRALPDSSDHAPVSVTLNLT